MKKLNSKGFTLIELLAVVTIMGILMLVAIPAISRTIENTRKDTFLDTAQKYVNSVKTMWTSDSLSCEESTGNWVSSSALAPGTYYVNIDSKNAGTSAQYPVLLESGGKSSWGNKNVQGYVRIVVEDVDSDGDSIKDSRKVTYSVTLTDGTHGIKEPAAGSSWTEYSALVRSDVATTGATLIAPQTTYCKEV